MTFYPLGSAAFTEALATVAANATWDELTLVPDNIFEGSLPTNHGQSPDESFVQDIANGPVLRIGFAKLTMIEDVQGISHYEIPMHLWFSRPKDDAQTLTDVLSLLETLKALWRDPQNFKDICSSATSIDSMSWELGAIDYTQDPAFGRVDISVTARMR